MHTVIIDVANYEKFLPWCLKSTILEKSKDKMRAELVIGFNLLKVRFQDELVPYLVGKIYFFGYYQ